MRNIDVRSRRIAVISEHTLNAHLFGDEEDRDFMRELEEEGYGVIQLPPDQIGIQAAEAAIVYIVDQVQDYLKNSYAVVDALRSGNSVAEMFRSHCRLRGINLPAFQRRSSG
jgi:uncharacterized NAD-dependent epimerase/dehydratase family protein